MREIIHMICERKDIFYKDTYLVFEGTDANFIIAMQKLQNEIDDDIGSRGDHDHLDDTPYNAYFNREQLSRWTIHIYQSSYELNARVLEIPSDVHYYNTFEITNISL